MLNTAGRRETFRKKEPHDVQTCKWKHIDFDKDFDSNSKLKTTCHIDGHGIQGAERQQRNSLEDGERVGDRQQQEVANEVVKEEHNKPILLRYDRSGRSPATFAFQSRTCHSTFLERRVCRPTLQD